MWFFAGRGGTVDCFLPVTLDSSACYQGAQRIFKNMWRSRQTGALRPISVWSGQAWRNFWRGGGGELGRRICSVACSPLVTQCLPAPRDLRGCLGFVRSIPSVPVFQV